MHFRDQAAHTHDEESNQGTQWRPKSATTHKDDGRSTYQPHLVSENHVAPVDP